ncbi:MAG TPA: MFS transporter [Acidimicrobiales bacterium]|nr:MFS transporter [Acidimicrobiales bacterium]
MTYTATVLTPLPAAARRHWWALPVLMTGTVMIVLDFFVVNVALPSMQAGLRATSTALEWVVAGYGLSFAVLMVSAGRLADRFGRRRMFCIGLALFAAASGLCGVAPTASVLVVARLVQGGAAALISPAVLSLIGVIYTGPDRVRAISVYGMAMGVAAAGGQLLGGALVQADVAGLGWRTIFLVNLPVALAGLALAPRLVPESRAERPPALDGAGVALVTAGLVALVLPLVQGRQLGWPLWAWVSLAASPLLLLAFRSHQRRLERAGGWPVMPPSLFADRSLRAGLLTQLGFWCGQSALFLVLALYLQEGRGLDPLAAGAVFSILACAYLATSLRAPALTLRYGRDLIAVGALGLAVGEGLLAVAVAVGGGFDLLVPGLVAAGAGMGLCITPLTTVVLAHSDAERVGTLSGALSTMQQVGNAVGVAVTGAIFFAAISGGVAHAFELAALELACLLTGVAALTRLLPSRRRSA